MSSSLKNLSETNLEAQALFEKYTVGIVVSEWNNQITWAMRDAAIDYLKLKGVLDENIIVESVPGSFELPLAAQWLSQNCNAVIVIGCVIQGETRHFDFICQACANGIMDLNLKSNIPIVFGVLTTQNLQQAIDRSGGKHGNKGIEAAETALKMLALHNKLYH